MNIVTCIFIDYNNDCFKPAPEFDKNQPLQWQLPRSRPRDQVLNITSTCNTLTSANAGGMLYWQHKHSTKPWSLLLKETTWKSKHSHFTPTSTMANFAFAPFDVNSDAPSRSPLRAVVPPVSVWRWNAPSPAKITDPSVELYHCLRTDQSRHVKTRKVAFPSKIWPSVPFFHGRKYFAPRFALFRLPRFGGFSCKGKCEFTVKCESLD